MPSVACLAASLALALVTPRSASAQDAAMVAQSRYARGVAHFEANRIDEALAEFRASLGAYHSPNSRLMVARCLARLGRHAEAVGEFDRTITDARTLVGTAPQYRPTLEVAERERLEAARHTGRLIVSIAPATAHPSVRMGGADVPAEGLGLPLPANAGDVEVETSAPGFRTDRRLVSVRAGEESRVTIVLAPSPEPRTVGTTSATTTPSDARATSRRADSMALLVAGSLFGTGAIGAIVASVVLVVQTQRRFDELSMPCVQSGMCVFADDPRLLEGQHWQTAANVLLWSGLGAATLSTSFFVAAGLRRPSVVVMPHALGGVLRAQF